jgi:hypothetical protein
MIVAIEGLIPDRRLSPSGTQPAAPPVNADIYTSEWLRKQRHQAASEEQGDAAAEAESAAPQVPEPESAPSPAPKPATDAPPSPSDRNQPSLADSLIPPALNRIPLSTDSGFHALLDPTSSLRQSFSIKKKPLRPAPLKSLKSQILSNFRRDKETP